MGTYLRRRALHSLLLLVGLVLLVFFMARLTGDPSYLYLPPDATPEMRHNFSEVRGFNDPLIVQFGHFLRDVSHLDFGLSMRQSRPALQLVLEAFPTTLKLAGLTIAISLSLAILTGSLAAWRPGGVFDRIASIVSLIGASAPNFWVAIVGVLVFAVGFRLVPTSGDGGAIYWVLPVAVLVLRPWGLIAQVVRGSMISTLSSGYVKTARAKGVPDWQIIFVHALRNAMLPVITVTGDQAAGLVNGAVVIETIFGFPGIGKLLIDSINFRDFSVLQATVLYIGAAIFILNIAIDCAYALLDPRIRYS